LPFVLRERIEIAAPRFFPNAPGNCPENLPGWTSAWINMTFWVMNKGHGWTFASLTGSWKRNAMTIAFYCDGMAGGAPNC
jgi:hypothetical protein